MNKLIRIILFIILVLVPIIFYSSFNNREDKRNIVLPIVNRPINNYSKAKIAIIFDGMGDSLKDLKDIYSLDIPVTVSVDLTKKFAKNVAYIGARSGFSVLMSLPLESDKATKKRVSRKKRISSSQTEREIKSLLRYYMNSVRIAIGINNHLISKTENDLILIDLVLEELKHKDLVFIDSRSTDDTIAHDLAKALNILSGYSEGFLHPSNDKDIMEATLDSLVKKAMDQDQIIIITYPDKNIIELLKKKIPTLQKDIDFITIGDYTRVN